AHCKQGVKCGGDPGSSVLLTFHHFELEIHASCSYDYIKIYNGVSEDVPLSWQHQDTCGTGLSGLISSPRYPWEYSHNCSWTIHASNGSVVSLVFMDFQLENNEGCNFDFLLVVFKSDFNIGGRGFKAYYYSGECQQVLSAVSGNFSSPHFPGIYPNNINCHWTLTLAAGYRIKLFFPLVDWRQKQPDGQMRLRLGGDLRRGQPDGPLLGRWCGAERPPSSHLQGEQAAGGSEHRQEPGTPGLFGCLRRA
ncbi:hypothetical protein NHX12_004732, partial [Muraenolepis orangiensis]